MTIKNAWLGRVEKLSAKIKEQHPNLPNKGLIIIESISPALEERISPIKENGFRDYLLTFGDFKPIDLEE